MVVFTRHETFRNNISSVNSDMRILAIDILLKYLLEKLNFFRQKRNFILQSIWIFYMKTSIYVQPELYFEKQSIPTFRCFLLAIFFNSEVWIHK